MTNKKVKYIILYTLLIGIIATSSIQPQFVDSSNDSNKNPENLDIEPLAIDNGLDGKLELETTSTLYNYSLYSNWTDGSTVYNVIVDGNFAFIANGAAGLRILNITDPSDPKPYGLYNLGNATCRDVVKVDTYLMVAYGSEGLIILDTELSLITPVFVKKIKSEFLSHDCLAVDYEWNFTYVAAGEFGFGIINTTVPEEAYYTGRFYNPTYGSNPVDIQDVDARQIFCYAADKNYGLRRVDVTSNKVSPRESGEGYPSGHALSVYIRDDYYAMLADYNGFYTLSLFSYPVFTVTYQYSDGKHPLGVYSAWDTAFVTYSNDVGMRMFNISGKENYDVQYVAQYNDTGAGYGIFVNESFAYIADGTEGLEIIELDSDDDYLYDNYEIIDLPTNESNPDTDADGFLDGEEFYGVEEPDNPYSDDFGFIYGMDPNDNDTDDDLIDDYEEVYLGFDGYRTNPLQNDSDSDGLLDSDEISTYLTDPNDVDTDGDGISDGDEVNTYGTSPILTDTDSDTMPDDYEIDNGLNATLDDSNGDLDSDGLTNIDEYSVYFTEPDNNDTDADSLTDGEEINGIYVPTHPYANGTGYIITGAPNVPDKDNDGLKDGLEVLTYNTNPLDPDCDDDGINDYQEVLIYNTDPMDSDTDDDGLDDEWEILWNTDPLVADATNDQDSDGLTNEEEHTLGTDPDDEDTDGDGIPDGWEDTNGLDPLDDTDAELDEDLDGLSNLEEYENDTNPFDEDTDGDGMNDQWEINNGTDPTTDDADEDPDSDGLTNLEEKNNGTDPFDDDSDRDGLSDGDEVNIYGTNPRDYDTDHDGYSDKTEIDKNTDPLDASKNPKQRNITIYSSIGGAIAGGILILLGVFFVVFYTTQPEQKMWRYLSQLRSNGEESVTLKDISLKLDKKLNRGDIKQLINEFSESKGFTLSGNRVYLTSESFIDKSIKEYLEVIQKAKSKPLTSSIKKDLKTMVKSDIKLCQKLGYNEQLTKLEDILKKLQ